MGRKEVYFAEQTLPEGVPGSKWHLSLRLNQSAPLLKSTLHRRPFIFRYVNVSACERRHGDQSHPQGLRLLANAAFAECSSPMW